MGRGIKAWRHLLFTLYCKHTLPHTHHTPAYAGKHTQHVAGGQRRDTSQERTTNWHPNASQTLNKDLCDRSGQQFRTTRVSCRCCSRRKKKTINLLQRTPKVSCLDIKILYCSISENKRENHTAEREQGALKG